MRRYIEEHSKAGVTERKRNLPGTTDAAIWLREKAMMLLSEFPQTSVYLLAHADDGVIWGRLAEDGQTLLTSHDVAVDISPPLRTTTLQQARIFCEEAEWLLWKDGDNQLHVRLLRETAPEPDFDACYEEPQMLWGTQARLLGEGFTLLKEGSQGLLHAIPITLDIKADEQNGEPLRIWLRVRHYLAKEPFARVIVSRLAGLQ